MATVAEMSIEELKAFIQTTLEEALTQRLGFLDTPGSSGNTPQITWAEFRARAEQHRWTPPPSAKSSQELLREDRDR